MEDEREQLRQSLAEVHRHLAGLGPVDPEVRARLEQTLQEIEAALAAPPQEEVTGALGQPGAPTDASREEPLEEDEEEEEEAEQAEENGSLAHRLNEAARHFEEEHPNLAGMLGSVIDALGRMGI